VSVDALPVASARNHRDADGTNVANQGAPGWVIPLGGAIHWQLRNLANGISTLSSRVTAKITSGRG
jgi:hypothetical protein